jgi:sulfite reductase (NADPH) hemoprotein beta-component
MLKIISANRLQDGIVVYVAAEGTWTADIDQAKRFTSEAEVEAGLKQAKADEKRNLIVEPFAVDVEAEPSGLKALTLRNAIRAKGPTVDYHPRQDQSARS